MSHGCPVQLLWSLVQEIAVGKQHGQPGFFNTPYCATWPNALALQKQKNKLKTISAVQIQKNNSPGAFWRLCRKAWHGCLPPLPSPLFAQSSIDEPSSAFPSPKPAEAMLSSPWAGRVCQAQTCAQPLLPLHEGSTAIALKWACKDHAYKHGQMDISGKTRLLERISIYNLDPARRLLLGVNVTECWFLKSLECLNREWKMKLLLACKWSFMPCAGRRSSHPHQALAAHWTLIRPIRVHKIWVIKLLHPF